MKDSCSSPLRTSAEFVSVRVSSCNLLNNVHQFCARHQQPSKWAATTLVTHSTISRPSTFSEAMSVWPNFRGIETIKSVRFRVAFGQFYFFWVKSTERKKKIIQHTKENKAKPPVLAIPVNSISSRGEPWIWFVGCDFFLFYCRGAFFHFTRFRNTAEANNTRIRHEFC